MHFGQRAVTRQPLEEVARVHVVRELPEEPGLGGVLAGADFDQLGIIDETSAVRSARCSSKRTFKPAQNGHRIVGLAYLWVS